MVYVRVYSPTVLSLSSSLSGFLFLFLPLSCSQALPIERETVVVVRHAFGTGVARPTSPDRPSTTVPWARARLTGALVKQDDRVACVENRGDLRPSRRVSTGRFILSRTLRKIGRAHV